MGLKAAEQLFAPASAASCAVERFWRSQPEWAWAPVRSLHNYADAPGPRKSGPRAPGPRTRAASAPEPMLPSLGARAGAQLAAPAAVRARVAYQGAPGAYSEGAALKAVPDGEPLPCEQFEVAFQALSQWLAERAVLPIENSVGGSIHTVYDLLLRCGARGAAPLTPPLPHPTSGATVRGARARRALCGRQGRATACVTWPRTACVT